jgi:hypothetical protein
MDVVQDHCLYNSNKISFHQLVSSQFIIKSKIKKVGACAFRKVPPPTVVDNRCYLGIKAFW